MKSRTSLKNEIAEYMRVVYPEWREKGAIERFAQEKGYDAENGARRARELENSKLLVRDPESKCTRYQYNPEFYKEPQGMKRGKSTYMVESQFKELTLW